MTDELKPQLTNDRPIYEPPRALRLGDTHSGAGQCIDGSGNTFVCGPGNNASGSGCQTPGNNASMGCDTPGAGVSGGHCIEPGANADTACDSPGSDATTSCISPGGFF
jgi:hypothetical protein